MSGQQPWRKQKAFACVRRVQRFMACLIKHDVVNTPFMCIPQGLSIMNYQQLMELIIQTEKKKKITGNAQGRRSGPSCVFLDYFQIAPF